MLCFRIKSLISFALPMMVISFVASSAATATVLTFDFFGFEVSQEYGDRVTDTTIGDFTYGICLEGFTPNILASYSSPEGAPRKWTSHYGDLQNVLYERNHNIPLVLSLSADPGYKVNLLHFDLAAFEPFVPISPVINSVRISDESNNLLYSVDDVLISNSRRTAFNFPIALQGQTLRFEIDGTNISQGFNNTNIGIDNVTFSQVAVPEPMSVSLGVLGAALMALGTRRRS